MTSIALPKSPVNFARGGEVPHILYTKVAPTARRILVIGENRLLQHNRAKSGHPSLTGSHGVAVNEVMPCAGRDRRRMAVAPQSVVRVLWWARIVPGPRDSTY
jgi:hypothetical protein